MNRPLTDSFQQRAVSSAVGYLLVLGITIATAVGIVVGGGAIIDGAQGDSQTSQAEQALTQFDSKAAQVALGDSESKSVGFGRGSYRVDESAGSITIRHESWDDEGGKATIYPERDFGAVVYDLGDTTLAYQGGGVWRKDADGDARMVSPPEFHYRSATLTFPIIHVLGDASRSGTTRAQVQRHSPVTDIFPNSDSYYDEEENHPFRNPVSEGRVVVEVESEYCEGWRSYFESRTDGEVSECEDNTVEADIVSIGTQGEFDLIDGTVEVRGADTDKEEEFEFEITLTQEGSDQSSGFNNHEWSMYGESNDDPDKLFEIHVEGGGGASCGDPVTVTMFHSPNGGETYQTWTNDTAFVLECPDGEDEVTIDFLGDTDMHYKDTGIYDRDADNPHYASETETDSFNKTQPLGTDGEPESIKDVTLHYFEEMGDMDLEFRQRQEGNSGIGDASSGNIFYAGDGRVITFLHITENEIEVDLE